MLVAIFQRGAADGISMVVPYGDRHYRTVRPQIAVESPIDLDGFFGFGIWTRGKLLLRGHSFDVFWQLQCKICVAKPSIHLYVSVGDQSVVSTR